jgi:hypothetical protein
MDDLGSTGATRALPASIELVRCEPFPVREGSHWPCGVCARPHSPSESKLAWVRRKGGGPEFSLVLCPVCALDHCGRTPVEVIDVTDETGAH